jgi:GDP-L-fucose synthase
LANDLKQKIYIAGHRGMVGSAIMRQLERQGYTNLVYRTRQELDLTNQAAVTHFFETEKPDQVYLAAAKVGGIYANNSYPAQFIYENLMVQNNLIHQAFVSGVKKLLFLGSSCIYPKYASQPMAEDILLTGKLEPTNEPYAIAKIAGIKMCESYNRQYGKSHGVDYRSVMPTNLYGPGDNYHPENSHVIPALIRRFHEAKINGKASVKIWGSGNPRREFLYVDDLAKACVFIMKLPKEDYNRETTEMQSYVNIGSRIDLTINELANVISRVIGYRGSIEFDKNMPDGPPRKLLDSSKINKLGWRAEWSLEEGLSKAYEEYCKEVIK